MDDSLSPDRFAQLMAATPEADILVILGDQATGIMVERARQLVALNQEVYALENDILDGKIAVCNTVENPFAPLIVFATPDCEIG